MSPLKTMSISVTNTAIKSILTPTQKPSQPLYVRECDELTRTWYTPFLPCDCYAVYPDNDVLAIAHLPAIYSTSVYFSQW